ncbi:hypothetical protein BDV18DRAFT_162611 [Aspergillus unguis]
MDPDYASETKGPQVLGVFWAFYIMSLVMVTARLYIRARWLRNIGLDDYIIVLCMVIISAYTALTTVNVSLGYGKHTQAIVSNHGLAHLSNLLLMNYIDFAVGIMSFTVPKFAIAALLNRILNPGYFHRIWLWLLSALVFVSSSICIIILFTLCDPPEALWHPELMARGATCRPLTLLVGYAIFTGAMSAFADIYLAIYPVVVLARLQITLKKKLALCAALGMGSVACAISIVKCFQLPSLYDTADSTYASTNLVLWTSIESNVIIMASCIPTLGPLWEMLLGKRSWSSHDNSYNYKRSGNKLLSASDPHSKKVRDADADLFATQIGTTREGSQERILQGKYDAKDIAPPVGSIQRTHQVVVEYELDGMEQERRRW